jgi:hypothetical protein
MSPFFCSTTEWASRQLTTALKPFLQRRSSCHWRQYVSYLFICLSHILPKRLLLPVSLTNLATNGRSHNPGKIATNPSDSPFFLKPLSQGHCLLLLVCSLFVDVSVSALLVFTLGGWSRSILSVPTKEYAVSRSSRSTVFVCPLFSTRIVTIRGFSALVRVLSRVSALLLLPPPNQKVTVSRKTKNQRQILYLSASSRPISSDATAAAAAATDAISRTSTALSFYLYCCVWHFVDAENMGKKIRGTQLWFVYRAMSQSELLLFPVPLPPKKGIPSNSRSREVCLLS